MEFSFFGDEKAGRGEAGADGQHLVEGPTNGRNITEKENSGSADLAKS
jgi:hypothetical protein